MKPITITHAFAEEHRHKAATLYYNAFYQKLHPIFRDDDRGRAVLVQALNPAYAIVALADDELVGLAGYQDKTGNLVDIQPGLMTEAFGWFGGWWRLLALLLFARSAPADTLLMDGIVVDPDQRGQGIGSHLLEAIIEYAQAKGYQYVRLDVVDTNPRARQLYERKGFVAVKSGRYPFLQRIFGFSGSTTMRKPLPL